MNNNSKENFTVLHFNSLNEFLNYLDSQSSDKKSNNDTSLRGKVNERTRRNRRKVSKQSKSSELVSYKEQCDKLTKTLYEKDKELFRLKSIINDLVGTIHSIKENVNKLTDITV